MSDQGASVVNRRSTESLENHELDVVFFPSFDGTSYQSGLAEGLDQEGARRGEDVTIRHAESIVGCWDLLIDDLLGRTSEKRVFHLHWIHNLFLAQSRWKQVLRPFITLAFLLAFRLAGRPVVWTAHNLTTHDDVNHPLMGRIVRHGIVRFLAARTFVHCDRAVDMLIETYRLPTHCQSKLSVVPRGSWPERIAADPIVSATDERDDSDRTYLAFGMIRPYKRLDTLARTFSEYAGEDSRLIIAGKVDEGRESQQLATRLRDFAASDPYGRIDLRMEYVPDDELDRLFAESDVMLAAYRDILTSGVTAVAAAQGVPVVGPRIGCLPSQVSPANRDLLYDSGDDGIDRRLGAAIERIEGLSTGRLAEIGAANREYAIDRDWPVTARGVRKGYTLALD